MDQVIYQCSVCGYPVTADSPNCPHCGSYFSGISQGTMAGSFGTTELAVAVAVGIGIGIIIGAMGAKSPRKH